MPVQVSRHEARRQNRVDLGAGFHFQLVQPSTSEKLGHAKALNMTLSGQTADHREAAKAFVEKRTPTFKGI